MPEKTQVIPTVAVLDTRDGMLITKLYDPDFDRDVLFHQASAEAFAAKRNSHQIDQSVPTFIVVKIEGAA